MLLQAKQEEGSDSEEEGDEKSGSASGSGSDSEEEVTSKKEGAVDIENPNHVVKKESKKVDALNVEGEVKT